MTENFPHSAAQNIPLLEAIKAGEATGPGDLATRAGVGGNLARKLAALTEDGLVVSTGESTHEVALTEAGEQALKANALFRGEIATGAGEGLAFLPIGRLVRWPDNPRTERRDPEELAGIEDLARNIADMGVLQAITVRAKGDDYEVIFGDRRRRACKLAVERGWLDDSFLVKAEIRNWGDDEALETAGVENLQREDMHWMDEAQWYAKLAQRLSGSAIERLVGGSRGKRSIQDYIKCARELSPQDRVRTYLPDGDKDQLTYVKARDLVGEKKERPALELSPKVAIALIEVIMAGCRQEGFPPVALSPGGVVTTRFTRAPVGGPLGQLAERKLITFGFDHERRVVSRCTLTAEVLAWLTQIGFTEDREAGLLKVRAASVGELQAGTYGPEDYLTPELNAPAAPSYSPPPPTEAREPAEPDPNPEPRGLDPSPAPAAAPASPAGPAELPAMLAIVVVEAAHRIAVAGYERGVDTWGVPVLTSYYKDGRGQTLVVSHKMLAFLPNGEKTLVAIGKAGRDWLWETYGVEVRGGKAEVTDEILAQAQMTLLGAKPGGALYSTPWLNPPVEAAAASPADVSDAVVGVVSDVIGEIRTAATEGTGGAGAYNAGRGDSFTQNILGLAAERRAKNALAGATRQALSFIEGLRTRSKAPKAEEIDPMVALLEAALEAIAPHLEEQADG